MTFRAVYAHTNLIARDWRALARFYEDVFGCVPVPPERDYAGPDLERGTGVAGARLAGVHLRLPGTGPDGPTLEIFAYAPSGAPAPREIHTPGLGHLAFAVSDVAEARAEVLARGGAAVGEVVVLSPAPGRRVEWCYVTDPEGNAIELQAWASVEADRAAAPDEAPDSDAAPASDTASAPKTTPAPSTAPARDRRPAPVAAPVPAPAGFSIRPHDPVRDAAAIRRLMIALHETERAIDPRLPPAEAVVDRYVASVHARAAEFAGEIWVAETAEPAETAGAAGVVAGLVSVFTRYRSDEPDDDPSEHAFVSDLVVAASHRGAGLGRALLRLAEARAVAAGAPSVRLAVRSGNAPAEALYAAEGFARSVEILEKRLAPGRAGAAGRRAPY